MIGLYPTSRESFFLCDKPKIPSNFVKIIQFYNQRRFLNDDAAAVLKKIIKEKKQIKMFFLHSRDKI